MCIYHWINEHLEKLGIICGILLNLVLAVATIVLAVYTYKLVKETITSRTSQLQPYILVYLEQSETSASYMYIIVQNIAKGVAYNLTFEILQDIGKYQGSMPLADRGLFKEGMKFFPPEYTKKLFLVDLVEDNLKKMEEEIILVAKYQSVFDKGTEKFIEEKFHLKISEHKRAGKISPSDTYLGSIDESLKEISKNFKLR
jgi:hypothetical protein